jgi:hypothetical protein
VIVSKIVNDYYYSKHPFDNYFEIVHWWKFIQHMILILSKL